MLNLKHDVALKRDLRKQAGFTLIELLIVIAIIAILAAIAIPQFLKYKQAAYIDSMRADVKNTVTAIEAFNAQYGTLPTGPASCGPGPTQCSLTATGSGNSTTTSTDALNVSRGNTITIAYTTCAAGTANAGSPGYTVSAASTQTTATVSYNSCTGAYSGF